MSGTGSRWSAAQLRLRIANSARINPDTVMPADHRTAGLVRVGHPRPPGHVAAAGCGGADERRHVLVAYRRCDRDARGLRGTLTLPTIIVTLPRAAIAAPGATEWLALDLYLMQRAAGMPMATPAVRL